MFLDETGSRWRAIQLAILLTVVGVLALAAWFVPRALAPDPSRDPRVHRDDTTLLGSLPRRLPVVGDGEMLRVFRVQDAGKRPYAADPFTGVRWRDLSSGEMRTVGSSTFGIDRFGRLPYRQLALTFDDGPDPPRTRRLCWTCRPSYHVPATFFDIGRAFMAHPDLYRREVREGHLVGNHTVHAPHS